MATTTKDIADLVQEMTEECPPTNDYFNSKYAIVKVGGTPCIILRSDPREAPMAFDAFVSYYLVNAKHAKKWLQTSPVKTRYGKLEFNPSTIEERLPNNNYNLWRGFAVEPATNPDPERWSLIRNHMLNNVTSGRELLYQWLLNWQFHMFQFPQIKPGVAPFLYGSAEGTGKDFVADQISRILMTVNYEKINSANAILDHYNGSLIVNALMIHGEEVFFSEERHPGGIEKLKSMITAEKLQIRFMKANPFTAPNYLRFWFTSNKSHPVNVSPTDRRMLFIDVPRHANMQNREYFAKIERQLLEGGLSHFLGCALKADLSAFNASPAGCRPHTVEHDEQVTLSMTKMDQFIAEHLLTVDDRDVVKGEFYREYVEFCQKLRVAPESNGELGKRLTALGCTASKATLQDRHVEISNRRSRAELYRFRACKDEMVKRLRDFYPTIDRHYSFEVLPITDEEREEDKRRQLAEIAAEKVVPIGKRKVHSGSFE